MKSKDKKRFQFIRNVVMIIIIELTAADLPTVSVRMAMAIAGVLPVLIIYPLVQNNFVKDVYKRQGQHSPVKKHCKISEKCEFVSKTKTFYGKNISITDCYEYGKRCTSNRGNYTVFISIKSVSYTHLPEQDGESAWEGSGGILLRAENA